MLTVCYLSQTTHVHVNGICTLIQTSIKQDSLPFRFDSDEADDEADQP